MKIKKYFIFLTTAIVSLTLLNGVKVSATEMKVTIPNQSSESIVPYAEETKWYYRYVNGKTQKRLWSYTYGKWLTDWEWVV